MALDLESAEEARAIVTALGASVSFYKVGLELYAAAGMDYVRELTGSGECTDSNQFALGSSPELMVMRQRCSSRSPRRFVCDISR